MIPIHAKISGALDQAWDFDAFDVFVIQIKYRGAYNRRRLFPVCFTVGEAVALYCCRSIDPNLLSSSDSAATLMLPAGAETSAPLAVIGPVVEQPKKSKTEYFVLFMDLGAGGRYRDGTDARLIRGKPEGPTCERSSRSRFVLMVRGQSTYGVTETLGVSEAIKNLFLSTTLLNAATVTKEELNAMQGKVKLSLPDASPDHLTPAQFDEFRAAAKPVKADFKERSKTNKTASVTASEEGFDEKKANPQTAPAIGRRRRRGEESRATQRGESSKATKAPKRPRNTAPATRTARRQDSEATKR